MTTRSGTPRATAGSALGAGSRRAVGPGLSPPLRLATAPVVLLVVSVALLPVLLPIPGSAQGSALAGPGDRGADLSGVDGAPGSTIAPGHAPERTPGRAPGRTPESTLAAERLLSPDLAARLAGADEAEFLPVIVSIGPRLDLGALEAEMAARGITTRWRRHRTVIERARAHTEAAQAELLALLQTEEAAGNAAEVRPFWVTNAVSCRLRPGALTRLLDAATLGTGAGILRVEEDRAVFVKTGTTAPAPAPGESESVPPGSSHTVGVSTNLVAIRAPEVWARGLTGAGRLVGHFDAGAEGDHVALAARWRGAREGVPWQHAWFDPYTGTDFPYGVDGGHGTGTLSVMVGTRPEGPPFGVAYEAEWIAAGVVIRYDVSRILAAFEWAADPDGDPGTIHDVPDVLNHSWGTSDDCATTYWDAIDLVEAAGTVNVIAVANAGPAPGSVDSPESRADSPYANFSVGGVDTNVEGFPVRTTSARGPSPCDGVSIKPELVGPGTAVPGAGPNDALGVFWSGTSFAAPHVSGVVALLRQLDPSLTVEEIKHALLVTARDLAAPGEDNDTGFGLVDAEAAVTWVERHITPSPPPFALLGPTEPAPVALLRWAPPRYLGRGAVPALVGYSVYRAVGEEPFGDVPIAEVGPFPTEYWDRSTLGPTRYMVTARYANGAESEPTLPVSLVVVAGSEPDVEGARGTPDRARVVPNPSGAAVEVQLELTRAAPIAIEAFDGTGRRVREVFRGTLGPGPHALAWDGRDSVGRKVPAGVYFLRLSDEDGQDFTIRVARIR